MIRKLEAITEPISGPAMSADGHAVSLMLEVGDQNRVVRLLRPMTATDIWHFFTTRYRKPDCVSLSGGVGRVTYHEKRAEHAN